MSYLSTNFLSYSKKSNTFTVEISELPEDFRPVQSINVMNPKTNNIRVFHLTSVDRDGSGEDIYVWNYHTNDGIRLLIINY